MFSMLCFRNIHFVTKYYRNENRLGEMIKYYGESFKLAMKNHQIYHFDDIIMKRFQLGLCGIMKISVM